jgi:hypothetical protein
MTGYTLSFDHFVAFREHRNRFKPMLKPAPWSFSACHSTASNLTLLGPRMAFMRALWDRWFGSHCRVSIWSGVSAASRSFLPYSMILGSGSWGENQHSSIFDMPSTIGWVKALS